MGTLASAPAIVTLEAPTEPFTRADLAFHGVDHSKASFEGRIFFNNPEADAQTDTGEESYAGSFWIFGHGGCAGDEGHCEVPTDVRPFDLRLEHQLTPMSVHVVVTDKLRQLVEPGQTFTVRVIPFVRPENAEYLPDELLQDLLMFDRVDLLTFQ